MTHDQDPLEELREGWRALVPPAPVRPLADEDPGTRAAVDWMATAWNSLEAPEPGPLPISLTDSVASPATPPRTLAPRLALALAAGLVAWFGFARSRPAHDTARDTDAAAPTPLELAGVEAATTPVVLAANDERVELRYGAVRLILLQPPATHAGGTPR